MKKIKKCRKCAIDKPLSSFVLPGSRETEHSWCDRCRTKYHKEYGVKYYQDNKAKIDARNRRLQQEQYNKRREYIQQLKNSKACLDCGVKYPFYVLDYDHLGDKLFNIGTAVAKVSLQRIIEEIKKCELVCANCHAMRSWKRSIESGAGLGAKTARSSLIKTEKSEKHSDIFSRKCSTCKMFVKPEDFNVKNKDKNTLHSKCRQCNAEYQQSWYLNNKEAHKERSRVAKDKIREYIRQIKEATGCSDCSKKYPYPVMQFDHKQDKKFEISKAVAMGVTLDDLKKEIAKCDLVCANCHRARTWKRKEALLATT